MIPKSYRKKPVVIEAISTQTYQDLVAAAKWVNGNDGSASLMPDHMRIHTLEGAMQARPGDYIIKGVAGEFYSCKPDIFKATYEEVKI